MARPHKERTGISPQSSKMIHPNVRSNLRRGFRKACRRLGILVVIAAMWSQAAPEAAGDKTKPVKKFENILIMPVINMSDIYGLNTGVRGPLSGQVFVTDVVVPEAAEFISSELWTRLIHMKFVELIEPNPHIIDSKVGLVPVQGSRNERLEAIQNAGRQMGADAVLCTYVYAFRKRVGNAFGVDVPAMVSFESVLVSSASGGLMWQKSFSETQQPLNENLLGIGKFLRRKGRWITAEEMATRAIDNMMNDFSASFYEEK